MVDRREFLHAGAAIATGAMVGNAPAARPQRPSPRPAQEFRTITYNVLACRGYPTRPENRVYLKRARKRMAERFAMELDLYAPDVVTFQESPSKAMVAAIAKSLGMNHTYFPGGFPGAVITKHEIVESQNCPLVDGPRPRDLYTRHWGRAVLRVRDQEIALFSAHLHPSKPDRRAREVTGMLATMAADLKKDRSFLFQGDLNHLPDDPEYVRWKSAGLIDTFATHGVGQPLTIPSTKPIKRIDYIWAHGPIAARTKECRVLFEGPFRTNPDDQRSFALSDHIAVMATFA
ncbi:MAG: hypothetical protein CMJ83_08515 [Planctomycetes bacterium]|nr:hypothetical protein [Planctomycetota bacterium]